MKKYWPLVLLAAFIAIGAVTSLQDQYGRKVPRATTWVAVNDEFIETSGTYSSSAENIAQTIYHGIWWQCYRNNGTIKIEALQASTGTAADFVECEDSACEDVVEGETGTSAHTKSLFLTPQEYLKIKLTETGGSGSAYCTVRVYLSGGG